MGIPSVKYLEHCQAPTLVRMQIKDASCFTFLGLRKTAFIPAFALMPSGQWEVQNLSSGHGFMPLYEGVSALDFRKRFDIRINYLGDCDLDKGGHRAPSFAPKTPCFSPHSVPPVGGTQFNTSI